MIVSLPIRSRRVASGVVVAATLARAGLVFIRDEDV